MTEAEAFRRLEEMCSLGHGNRVCKRRDCMTCQVLLLVEVTVEEREACANEADIQVRAWADATSPPGKAHKMTAERIASAIRARP